MLIRLRQMQEQEYQAVEEQIRQAQQKAEQEEKEKQLQAEKQAQEEQRRLEEEKKQEEEKAMIREKIAKSLPEEPKDGAPDAMLVIFRLPDGERVQRRFSNKDKAEVRRLT